jgi:hypothetical protein
MSRKNTKSQSADDRNVRGIDFDFHSHGSGLATASKASGRKVTIYGKTVIREKLLMNSVD